MSDENAVSVRYARECFKKYKGGGRTSNVREGPQSSVVIFFGPHFYLSLSSWTSIDMFGVSIV